MAFRDVSIMPSPIEHELFVLVIGPIGVRRVLRIRVPLGVSSHPLTYDCLPTPFHAPSRASGSIPPSVPILMCPNHVETRLP